MDDWQFIGKCGEKSKNTEIVGESLGNQDVSDQSQGGNDKIWLKQGSYGGIPVVFQDDGHTVYKFSCAAEEMKS